MGDVGERRGAENVGENKGAGGGKLAEIGSGERVFVGKMIEDKRMLNKLCVFFLAGGLGVKIWGRWPWVRI